MAIWLDALATLVNGVLTPAANAVMTPIAALPVTPGLLLLAAPAAALMVAVVARVSDQPALRAERRGVEAALFEIRLFADDPVATLRACGEIARRTARYLRLSLVPFAWLALPMLLLVAQLHAFYGYSGINPGAAALVIASVRPGASPDGLSIEPPPGVVATGAIWFPRSREVWWRVTPADAGAFSVIVRDRSAGALVKSLDASPGVARRSPRRGGTWLDRWRHPSEPPLPPGAAVWAIDVVYPASVVEVFGWKADWIVIFIGLAAVWAVGLARLWRVTI